MFGAGESAEAHLLMGIAHLGQQDYPAAKTELERAIKLNPAAADRALALRPRAAGARRAGRRGTRVPPELDLNVNDFEANLQLGNMRKASQRFAEASIYLERATTIRPTDLTARKLLASLRLQTGKVDEAVTMLEAIAKDAPDTVEAHVQLATAYNRLEAEGRRGARAGDRRSAECRGPGQAARRRRADS